MTLQSIAEGTRLAPDEVVVWQGHPSWRVIARDVFHLRALVVYLVFLAGLDACQAWAKAIPFGKALHDSVPLAIIVVALLANCVGLAWLTARSTRYTITTRSFILAYGVALPATLAIPHTQIEKIELALGAKHAGDIALSLRPGNRMPYLKLWPLARPWHVTRPQPMLRGVERAVVVASLATRAVQAATAAQQPVAPSRKALAA